MTNLLNAIERLTPVGSDTICGKATTVRNERRSEMPPANEGKSCETCLRIAQRRRQVGGEAVCIRSWHLFPVQRVEDVPEPIATEHDDTRWSPV